MAPIRMDLYKVEIHTVAERTLVFDVDFVVVDQEVPKSNYLDYKFNYYILVGEAPVAFLAYSCVPFLIVEHDPCLVVPKSKCLKDLACKKYTPYC